MLRQRQIIVHSASAQMNDYYYVLTDQGRQLAQRLMESCAYVGSAPVPMVDYIVSVEAQTIRAEAPKQHHLAKAFADISVEPELFDQLGPAINSGPGCSCTAHRATARRRWPRGSRCVSARTSGFRRR